MALANPFISNKSMHKKLAFRELNPSLTLGLPCALYSVYTPSVGVLDLLSTFVLAPFLIFTEEDPDFVPEDV